MGAVDVFDESLGLPAEMGDFTRAAERTVSNVFWESDRTKTLPCRAIMAHQAHGAIPTAPGKS